MRTVVVTGTSTGIGRAAVAALAADGTHVVATVRRAADGDALRADLGEAVTPVVADVTDPGALAAAAAATRERLAGTTLGGLVVNAGVALGGPLLAQPMAEIRQVLEVNLFGALETVRAFAPLLGTEPGRTGAPGRIVMVGSVSGWRAVPFLGAYAASKHALKAVTESLRGELLPFGVDVVLVEPGPVVTPIWEKGLAQDDARYADTPWREALARFATFAGQQGAAGLPAETVGAAIRDALDARTPATRRVVVRGRFLNFTLPSLLPDRLFDAIIAKQFGLTRR